MKNTLVSKRFIGFVALIVLFLFCFFRAPNPGLNWFLYACGAFALTFIVVEEHQYKSIIIPGLGLVLSGLAVFMHSDGLAVTMTLLSFGYLGVALVIPKVDPGFATIAGFGNFIISPFGVIIRFFQRLNTKNGKFKGLFTTLLIPGVLIGFFSLLYYESSPAFKDILNHIRIDHFPQFVGTATLGLFAASVLLYCFAPQKLNSVYDNISNKSSAISEYMGNKKFLNSWLLGIWSVVVLLAFVITSDIIYQASGRVAEGFNYSSYVHQGVYASIVSIIASAILTVLTTNYLGEERQKSFKLANYIFIGLNAVFVWQNVLRNYSYVSEYGLTEKRLIIFIYLVLCLIGLALTILTVVQNKSLGFLYKTNAFNVYTVLIVSALTNWSTFITDYNLTHPYGVEQRVDYDYLLSLDKSNTYLLSPHAVKMNEQQLSRLEWRENNVSNYNYNDVREWELGKSRSKARLNATKH
ncbi:MAG: hypothetical protein ACI9UJ_002022 [bacterium]|jgi:hypothetical protein